MILLRGLGRGPMGHAGWKGIVGEPSTKEGRSLQHAYKNRLQEWKGSDALRDVHSRVKIRKDSFFRI